jgi:GntR family transcriptional regulator/MocR family aminotransferase
MRALYAERQEALLDSAGRWLGDRLEVRPTGAGMHLVGWLAEGVDDRMISARAYEMGVEVPPISRYALTPLTRGGLLLGWAGYSPAAMDAAMERLAAALSFWRHYC